MCNNTYRYINADGNQTQLFVFLFLRRIFFLTSLLEYNCLTMVCQFLLYIKVNQLYIYIYPHNSSLLCLPPTLPIPPLQVVTKHRANHAMLCSCFPLAIYFTFGSVYMSMPPSHFVPAYPSHSPQLYLQQPGHGSNLSVHQQMNG